MKTLLAGLVVSLFLIHAAAAQTPASAPRPSSASPAAAPASAASAPSTPPVVLDEQTRKDIQTILKTTSEIAKTQIEEGSLLLKVRDGFLTNILWELFGFKSTEKTIVGYLISAIGVLGLVLKAIWFLTKDGKPEPPVVRLLTYAYLFVVVAVFTMLSFSGGVAAEVPASSSAAKPLLDASARLEAAADRLSRAASFTPPVGVSAAGGQALVGNKDSEFTQALSGLRQGQETILASSKAAVTAASAAAGRSTGWGWHLIIVLLLLGILASQLVLHAQSQK